MSTEGMETILACRSDELGRQTELELQSLGLNAKYRHCDISSKTSINEFVEEIEREYPSIDVLVNNAAIAFKGSDPTPFCEQARPTIETNFFGTLHLTQSLLHLLKKSSSARIVNVASQSGLLRILKSPEKRERIVSADLSLAELMEMMSVFVHDVEAGSHTAHGWPNTCYGTSKLGVIALTRILARDEPSILVNACCPGYCATDMSSFGGPRTAEEGARTPAYLATLSDGGPTGDFFYDEHPIAW